jgi:hypothetical protein
LHPLDVESLLTLTSGEGRAAQEVSHETAGAGLASTAVRSPGFNILLLLPIEDAKWKPRAHRQRTQGYIRELEKEVLRLRDREDDYLRKNEVLTEKVTSLEQHILASNIVFPQGYELAKTELDQGLSAARSPSAFGSDDRGHSRTPGLGNSDSETGWSSGSIVGTVTPSAMVNIDLTQLSNLDPFRFENYDVDNDVRPEFLPPQSAKTDQVVIPQLSGTRQALNSQDGADFVLT